jgi:hypothetical protein
VWEENETGEWVLALDRLLERQTVSSLEASLAARYEALFQELSRSSPEGVRPYPLGANRRANIIARIAAVVQHMDHLLRSNTVLLLSIWWRTSAAAKRGAPPDWHQLCATILGAEGSTRGFPTEDEWLSAVACVLVRAVLGHYAPGSGMLDFVNEWKRFRKAERIDRMIRGFSLVGAIANVVSALAPAKLPKEGSLEWHVYRRACAQVEAIAATGAS